MKIGILTPNFHGELWTGGREAILPKSQFPLNLPFLLAQKIQKGTLDGPILKQFPPTHKESIKFLGFPSNSLQIVKPTLKHQCCQLSTRGVRPDPTRTRNVKIFS